MRRRAVLVPAGTAALILAGIVAADVISDSREGLAAGTAAAGATVSGTATAGGSRSLPPGFGRALAERTGGASIPRERAATALCLAQPDAVRGLASLSKQAPATVESLRDGLSALEERLDEVELAAEGRPALAPVTERLATVRGLWRTAISASDAGREADAVKALARAERELDALATDLRKAYPGSEKDCRAVTAGS